MTQDMFSRTVAWDHDEEAKKATRPPWLLPALAGIVGTLLLGGLVGFLAGRRGEGQTLPPQARQIISEAYVGEEHVLLTDSRDGRAWLWYFRTNAEMLGQPLWGERSYGANLDCVGFTNYIVCRSPDPALRGTGEEYAPLALGESELPEGVERQLGAPRADIVQRYADLLKTRHQDWFYWLGRPLSQPFCPADGDDCFQAFARQIVHWPNRPDAAPADVQLSPLGLTPRLP